MQHFSILAGLLFPLSAFAQTFTDTYTTSNGWVAINPVSTTIQGGSFNFNGTYCGGVDDYKFKPLGFTLSNAKWTLDFEWTAQSGTTTGPSALIASLTSETSDPECNTWPNDITNNNTISVLYNSCFGCGSSDYGIEMITKAGAGTYVWHQALHIPLPAQQTGYIRCERVSSTLGRISVFADAARTVHLPGSPACFPIDQNIVNLKYLQHGAWVPGDNSRALWGSLDNTVVENNINHTTPTALTATINSTGSLCGNSTVQLQASGGSNYQWSNGTVGAINTVSQGGTYTVTATAISSSCGSLQGTASVTVVQLASVTPTIFIEPIGSICASTRFILTAQGGGTSFLWSNGATDSTQLVLTPRIYTVTVTNAIGCTATATTSVIFSTPINLNTFVTNENAGQANGSAIAMATGGAGQLSYLWNTVPQQTTQIATGLLAGTYTVTITDQNGCSITASAIVSTITATAAAARAFTNFTIAPNPSNGNFVVKADFAATTNVEVSVTNAIGQLVFTTKIGETMHLDAPVDLGNQASGVYFLSLKTQDGTQTQVILVGK
ncbi:MAG: hypothetical protein RI894_1686 [Bacteroidota bacterium]|jgi:hypothetical protein